MTSRTLTLAATAVILFPWAPVSRAEDLALDAPISAVTVFPDRAAVTRTGRLDLAAGSHTAVLTGLPAGLIAESLQVTGTGGEALLLGSVETRPLFGSQPANPRERELEGQIQALEDEGRAVEDRLAAARIQLDFIQAIGKDLPKRANEQIRSAAPDPEIWRESWAALGAGAGAVLEAIRTAELDQRGIERRLDPLRRELDELRTGAKDALEARIDLVASAPVTTAIEVTYQVPGAGWRPLYDARLDTASGRLTLTQRGEVRQATGEAWQDVALTLSTARPGISAELPELQPCFIDIQPPRPPQPMAAEAPAASYRGGKGRPEPQQEMAVSLAKAATADIVSSEFTAEYRIPFKANLAADNAPRAFAISELPLDTTLAVRTVPKLDTGAYLYGRPAWPGPEPLLGGDTSIFRDGGFVGRTRLQPVRPGESFDLTFGLDDKVVVD
jgi:uncharacterized protein (TIGR02231 family)